MQAQTLPLGPWISNANLVTVVAWVFLKPREYRVARGAQHLVVLLQLEKFCETVSGNGLMWTNLRRCKNLMLQENQKRKR
jgi:hypothetical protein